MTRQMQIHKWTLYTLALLAVFLLDAALLSQFPIAGVCPVLLPLAVAAVAVFEGGIAGAWTGFLLGMLWVGGYGNISGMSIFFLTVMGLLVGSASQYMFQQSLWGYFLCCVATLGVLEVGQVGSRLFFHVAPITYLLPIALTEFSYTICFAPLVYLIFYRVFCRVGGTRLA